MDELNCLLRARKLFDTNLKLLRKYITTTISATIIHNVIILLDNSIIKQIMHIQLVSECHGSKNVPKIQWLVITLF